MRFAVAYFGILVAIVVLAPLLPTTMSDETQSNLIFDLSLMTVGLGLYYYLIAKYMKQIAGVTQNDTVEEINQ
jgi:dipeptide/tripeptide permease